MVIFGRFSSEISSFFGRKLFKNDHSMPHGVLIKSGVILARIRYSDYGISVDAGFM